MIIIIVLIVIVAIVGISIAVYKDWARHFQDEYYNMMDGYERREKEKHDGD